MDAIAYIYQCYFNFNILTNIVHNSLAAENTLNLVDILVYWINTVKNWHLKKI